jgi:hypothetical protein
LGDEDCPGEGEEDVDGISETWEAIVVHGFLCMLDLHVCDSDTVGESGTDSILQYDRFIDKGINGIQFSVESSLELLTVEKLLRWPTTA